MTKKRVGKTWLRSGVAAAALAVFAQAVPAYAEEQTYSFDLPAQDLGSTLKAFARASRQQITFDAAAVQGKRAPALHGRYSPRGALEVLLQGSGLRADSGRSGLFIVRSTAAGETSEIDPSPQDDDVPSHDIIVTARKKEESIQNVPIAITAIKQEDLTTRQVTGGPDLITQVPNMTFTKTNFTGYSIQIRGIGTQAISATTDVAVAVAFNNTPFIHNRFFEQEFYDLDRVEVLRGPQGTLYGRNATAGVVNLISHKPDFVPEAKLSFDYGSYNQRRGEGMINVALLDDKLALRIAGAFTIRDGYDTNSLTGASIDGRDLWSTRTSLRFKPTDRFEANLIWEHFQEGDDRLRSGKQLCATDEKTEVAGFQVGHLDVLEDGTGFLRQKFAGVQPSFSQGCKAASLYAPESFGTPEGLMLPYYLPLGSVGLPTALTDPYESRTQSTDLRTIESAVEPIYKARSNIFELQLGWNVADNLKLTSETAYNTDFVFSEEDYNRFNTAPGAFEYKPFIPDHFNSRDGVLTPGPVVLPDGTQTAIFCDPQIGCSDRLVGIDLSTGRSTQLSQEIRLTSSNKGPFNFSLGANYLRFSAVDKYYVFFNSLGLISAEPLYGNFGTLPTYVPGVTDNRSCLSVGQAPADPTRGYPVAGCTFIDPNPIDKLNDQGHNYFLSDNPYRLSSYAIFGEAYYDISHNLRLTAGGRLTIDKKEAPRIPSWLLAGNTTGYPVAEVIRQQWTAPTGKISLDWKPDLSFTDSTLLYASASHGYKPGGANPPRAGYVYYANADLASILTAQSASHPKTFAPEYINAFEIGAKNTLAGGKVTINLAAFYYDYHGYQISQIVDRSASNLNFDATIWGAELESSWSPTRNLQFGVKLGYERTRLADGSKAIDLMDRTAGDPDWTLHRPFPTNPSSCILPTALFQGVSDGSPGLPPAGQPFLVNLGGENGGNAGACELAYQLGYDPVTDAPYVPNPTTGGPVSTLKYHPGYAGWDPSTAPNNGEGIDKDLSGNELPNAPHITASVTADFSLPLTGNWIGTLHGDFYYQSASWARIFNTPGYDRIRGYTNFNLALLFNNKPGGWSVMGYVKNVFNTTAITGAFLNSDDSGLTTNVFLTEPRRYGIRITKDFSGLPFGLGYDAGTHHKPGTPYPVTIEGGIDLFHQQGKVASYQPAFAGAFADDLDAFTPLQQDRKLAWKDATDVSLIIQPNDTPWKVTANVRYGKVENNRRGRAESLSDPVCYSLQYRFCSPTSPYHNYSHLVQLTNYDDAAEHDIERHLFVDFVASHDVGLGSRVHSYLGLGARYADLHSDSDLDIRGIPDNNQPFNVVKVGISPFHGYQSYASIRRAFIGAGPIAKWDGSYDLFGSDDTGKIDVDWSVTGGMLFGRRKAHVSDDETTYNYTDITAVGSIGQPSRANFVDGATLAPTSSDTHTVLIDRKHTATVPTLGGSLGLSYTLGRISVGGGYRWERYFGAIDGGGADGAKSYDRTIQGPYLKISFGFGN